MHCVSSVGGLCHCCCSIHLILFPWFFFSFVFVWLFSFFFLFFAFCTLMTNKNLEGGANLYKQLMLVLASKLVYHSVVMLYQISCEACTTYILYESAAIWYPFRQRLWFWRNVKAFAERGPIYVSITCWFLFSLSVIMLKQWARMHFLHIFF